MVGSGKSVLNECRRKMLAFFYDRVTPRTPIRNCLFRGLVELSPLGRRRQKGLLARKTPCCARLRSNPSGSTLAYARVKLIKSLLYGLRPRCFSVEKVLY